MVWFAQFTNTSNELRRGVDVYFAPNGIVDGGPPNGASVLLTFNPQDPRTNNVIVTPDTVIITDPGWQGRITFFGQGLTMANAPTPNPNSGPVPVFTGGTITGFELLFNYRLADAIDTGIGNPDALRLPQFLEPAAQFVLPNVPAVTLGQAVAQAYQNNTIVPIVNWFSQDTQNWVGSDGVNLLSGTPGNDLLNGLGGNDALSGGPGDDTLIGGPGVDQLEGGAGNDLFLPAPSGPPMGGFPNTPGDSISDSGTAPGEVDTVSYRNATAPVTINLDFNDFQRPSAGPAERVLIANSIEVIEGSPFNDLIIGRNEILLSNDTLVGLAGSDTIEGRAGSDVLVGGPGDDFLDGGTNFDSLGNPGPGDVAVFNASSTEISVFRTQAGSFLVVSPGEGIDELINIELLRLTDGTFPLFNFALSNRPLFRGGPGPDRLDGSPGDDLLFGGDGADTLVGGAGDDLLEGGDGADTLDGGPGIDNMIGGAGGDLYFVDVPEDRITEFSEGGGVDRVVADSDYALGSAHIEELTLRNPNGSRGVGNDLDNLILGADGSDTLRGGNGADTLNGGDGDDVLIGGATDADLRDLIFGGAGDDSVDGGHGNDELWGGAGNDTMEGGAGADTVRGQDGDDVLTGSAFSDLIFGGDGFDFINGGFGSDRVNGGDGVDRFFHVGVAGHGSDWIQDFSHAEGDRLVWGGGAATADQFQVNIATTPGAGDAGTDEAFVIYRPTGQILWALVDGAGDGSINLALGGAVYDLLA